MKHIQLIKGKICPDRDTLIKRINHWRQTGDSVVFTNGCFDILHLGHLTYLSDASDLGDHLVIGVNSDASVARLKGPERPLQDEYSRMMLLSGLQYVDTVVPFDEDDPLELIKTITPDILVKGADYTIDRVIGADYVVQQGGRVELINFIDGYSTTNIVNKIKASA